MSSITELNRTQSYSCLKLKPIYITYLNGTHETGFMFDWQYFGVSSIKFDYQTQSTSIKRLEFDWVRLLSLFRGSEGRGDEGGWGSTVGCRLKFSYFVGSRLKFSLVGKSQ